MQPLFPPWSNSVMGLCLAVGALLVASIPVAAFVWVRTPYTTGVDEVRAQPVKFDHRHHVGDDGIDCLYCHYEAERSPHAGVGSTELCMGCHGQVWVESPELAAIRRSWAEDVPIAWERVTNVPDHVFFDHSIHLRKGVGCVTCHGRVDKMAAVYKVETFTMAFCLDCHRSPERFLRPRERVTDMAYVPTRPQLEVGRELARLYDVRPGTDCSSCHR